MSQRTSSAFAVLAAVVVCITRESANAQVTKQSGAPTPPRTVSTIPLFPGATRVAADTSDKEGWEEFSRLERHQLDSLRSQQKSTYEAAAHPEAVYNFYKEALGGQEHYLWSDFEYEKIPTPGATTVIFRIARPYIQPTAAERQLFAARPPLKPDQWICLANFYWLVREPNGDVSQMMVAVRDVGVTKAHSIARHLTAYTPRARIVFMQATYVDPAKATPKFGLPASSPFYCF